MKKIILILTSFFLILGCENEAIELREPSESILGTWKFIGYDDLDYSGIFNIIEVEDGYEFTVKQDSTFTFTEPTFQSCSYGKATIMESEIIFGYECETSDSNHSYDYLLFNDTLSFVPNFLLCAEGCLYLYKRVE